MANSDFMRFSLGVYSREQTAAFLDKLILWQERGLPPQFAVKHRADNRLIGYCGFFHQQVDHTNNFEIGYRLHPDYWNKGLATEAARAVRKAIGVSNRNGMLIRIAIEPVVLIPRFECQSRLESLISIP